MLADYILIFSALCGGIFFIMLGSNALYKFYLGVVIGFLLFLVFNSQINLLENLYIRDLSSFQEFLVGSKELVLTLAVLSIPFLGILSAANQSFTFHGRKSVIGLFLFGALLPLFLVGLLAYISEKLYIPLPFLSSILNFFQDSYFFDFFREHLSWILLSILFLIFYKAFFLLLFAFVAWIYEILRTEFFGEREEESDDEETEE